MAAHRVDLLRCESSDAIGAKRTCRRRSHEPNPPLALAHLQTKSLSRATVGVGSRVGEARRLAMRD
jgi:hypothetical protein